MRIGLLGGSFDPVHYGHLLLAECCREQARLDEVWFMPAAQSPHKRSHLPAPAAARLAMLELATGGEPAFRVCRHELDRGGLSYTVDTLTALGAERPEATFALLLGADALDDFPRWREPARIAALAELIVVCRPPVTEPNYAGLETVCSPEYVAATRSRQVTMPQLDLSSRSLRERVAQHQSIRYRTPRAVEEYIRAQSLYRE